MRRRTVIVGTVVVVAGLRWLGHSDGGGDAPATPAAPERSPRVEAAEVADASDDGELVVRRVIDGDTLVLNDGRHVRLAQVDADETSECFGDEATEALESRTLDERVRLRRPPSGPSEDRYGRTLADVLVDGESVNEALVRDGAAGWYRSFASEDADLADRLSDAEAEARQEGRGMWSACRR